jgi:predicted GNAT family N-acyltransferase
MPDEKIIVINFSSALMPAVFALRHEIFVVEQAVPPELERDEFDADAIHLVALRDDEVIGTLRIVRSGQHAKIGRMAVRAAVRKSGVGSRLIQHAEVVASQMGLKEIVLHAQLAAKGFYRRLGYSEVGDIFEEAGIPHVEMRKALA